MKNILKLTALLTGAIANVTIAMASPAIVIRPTVAADAIAKVKLATAPVNNAVSLKIFLIVLPKKFSNIVYLNLSYFVDTLFCLSVFLFAD